MGSNITALRYLVGKYGVFAPSRYGNTNTTGPLLSAISGGPINGWDGNVVPTNLSTANIAGTPITNGNYAGQGITGAFDTGPILYQQASNWAKWGIMVRHDIPGGTIGGLSATLYGTWDEDTANGTLTTYNANGIRTAGNENWFQLVTGSTETSGDTAVWSNPLTALGQAFWCNTPVLAIRINVTALVSGSVLFAIHSTQ